MLLNYKIIKSHFSLHSGHCFIRELLFDKETRKKGLEHAKTWKENVNAPVMQCINAQLP